MVEDVICWLWLIEHSINISMHYVDFVVVLSGDRYFSWIFHVVIDDNHPVADFITNALWQRVRQRGKNYVTI